MSHKLDADDLFIHRFQAHCAEHRLNFFLIEPLWAEAFLARLEAGELTVRVLLNMQSEHHDPTEIYHRLIRAADRLGTQVIDPPDLALAAFDKARLHPQLAAAGLPVPPTIIVPAADRGSFTLTDDQRDALGKPFVIKPALGYGRRGVIIDATSEADLQRSAALWPEGNHLLQRRVVPRVTHGEPAYFRVYFVFGATHLVWWNCFTDRYRTLGPDEEAELGLQPLRDLAQQVARLTGMRFFSSEIAQTESGDFVLIDYVNDQCHMLAQSADPRIGVPDELVGTIARQLVENAARLLRSPAQQ